MSEFVAITLGTRKGGKKVDIQVEYRLAQDSTYRSDQRLIPNKGSLMGNGPVCMVIPEGNGPNERLTSDSGFEQSRMKTQNCVAGRRRALRKERDTMPALQC